MKLPPNTPSKGDRCKLRGRPRTGKVVKHDPQGTWVTVKWDDAEKTMLCDKSELEKIE